MALGDNRFDISSEMTQALTDQGIQVPVTRSQAAENVPRDKFGRPTGASTTATITILVDQALEDIKPTAAGGQPVEVLQFYAQPGDINEGDEVTWNGHVFRTSAVWPFGLGGMTQLVSCKAEREVDK